MFSAMLVTNVYADDLNTTVETPIVEPVDQIEPTTAVDFDAAQAVTIALDAPLYADAQLTKAIGTWQGDVAVASFSIVGEAIELKIGVIKVYVSPSDITVADAKKPYVEKSIGYVHTNEAYTIYADVNDTKLAVVTNGTKTRIPVTGMEGTYYTVDIAGVKGYLAKKDTTINLEKSIKVLKNTSIMQGSKKVATVTTNGVIKATAVKGNVYMFNNKYTVTTDAIVESNADASLPKAVKASTYKVTLTAQKAAGIYNAKGEKFAEIPAKSKISLINVTDKYGVISLLGGQVYVDLKDFKHTNLIAGEKVLTHHEMSYKLQVFAMMYPEFMELEEIGKSVEGRTIQALTVGTGKKQILMDASMHAREHMTTNVLMEMIDNYSYHYIHNSKFAGYNVRNVLDRVRITFVPMMNPDGVTLVQGGKVSTPRATLIKLNGGSTDFSRWKANISGVDLNRNWDVRWNGLPKLAPKWELAKGSKPFSEPETIALRDFVLEHPFKAYITYHSSGQIMFWEYGNGKGGKAKATALVRDISKVTGYSIMKNSQTSITAASEPWVGKKKDAPAVTMEIAPYAGNGPVPLSRWASVWKKNQSIGLLVANKARGY